MKPYRGTPDELAAIDAARAEEAISDAELLAYFRGVAERLRGEAERTGNLDARLELLALAEKFDQFADSAAKMLGETTYLIPSSRDAGDAA
jgi:hypothetical protein